MADSFQLAKAKRYNSAPGDLVLMFHRILLRFGRGVISCRSFPWRIRGPIGEGDESFWFLVVDCFKA
jgi:hypothetical protein